MTDKEAITKLIESGRYEEANCLMNLFCLEQETRQADALELVAAEIGRLQEAFIQHWNLG